jgi:hypothetical protein
MLLGVAKVEVKTAEKEAEPFGNECNYLKDRVNRRY